MKILCVLGCAVMLLAAAEATEEEADQTETNKLVKQSSNDWSKVNDRDFLFVQSPKTWTQAETYCQALGGNLASVRNKNELQSLQNMVFAATHQSREAWIGGSQKEGTWFWADGTRFIFTNWCKGEPNNYNGRQHCLQMNHRGFKCWDDLQCSYARPFLCVKKRC